MNKYVLNQKIEFDKDGFLKNYTLWNKFIAKSIAKSEKLSLNEYHWNIIFFFRDYHHKYKIHPLIREIIDFELSHIKKHQDSNKNYSDVLKHLYLLFPKGPLKQASKISGLPNPKNCFFQRYLDI